MSLSLSKLSVAVCALGLSLSTYGADKADLLAKIKAQASQYNEFRELLNSPDQSIRAAAFDGMITSGDATLRDIAIDEALANEDATMQALALREAVMGLDSITFVMELPEKASERTKKHVIKWANTYALTMNKKDKTTGQFSGGGQDNDYKMKGNVSGTELIFTNKYCNGKATLVDGTMLKGILSCGDYMDDLVSISAKIR